MSEEDLVTIDILTRPAPELSSAKRDEGKKVAKQSLAKLKDLLVIDWRKKSNARSQLKLSIEDTSGMVGCPGNLVYARFRDGLLVAEHPMVSRRKPLFFDLHLFILIKFVYRCGPTSDTQEDVLIDRCRLAAVTQTLRLTDR